jgi:hypothetical protein
LLSSGSEVRILAWSCYMEVAMEIHRNKIAKGTPWQETSVKTPPRGCGF